MKKLFGLFLCVFFTFVACKGQETPKPQQKEPNKPSALAKIESMQAKSASGVRSFTINEEEKKAILVLPIDHDFTLSSIKPSIDISKGASISPATDVAQDFSSGKTVSYTVTAENGAINTYVASVKILGARGNLNVDSIFICGEKVENNRVTVPAKYSFVEKKEIRINFTGEDVPTSFSASEDKIILNNLGESKVVTFSTTQTDRWNAWNSLSITITRAGEELPPSSEKKILDFYISFNVDDDEGNITSISNKKCTINEASKEIRFTLPIGSVFDTIKPNIRCSTGALIIPPTGLIDFKNSMTNPVIYTVQATDGSTQTYRVMIDRSKSSKAIIKSFKVVSGRETFIGKEVPPGSKKIFVGVRGDIVDITKIKPKIRLSNDATVSPTADTEVDFSNSVNNPIIYTVRAEDGVATNRYEVSIRLLSTEANIESFSLNIGGVEKNFTITGENIKLNEVLPIGTDVSALKPTMVISRGATVSPTAASLQNFKKPVKYVVTAEDKHTKKTYTVTVEIEKSHEAEILIFAIDGEEGDIDHANKTISVRLSEGHSLKDLVPTIKVSDGAKVVPKSGEKQDFTNPVSYEVTAEDGTTKNTYVASVTTAKSNEAKILKFRINLKDATINHTQKTISLELPKGTVITALTPMIEVSRRADYTPKGAQNFTNPVSYEVTAEDGTKNVYTATVTVKTKSSEAQIKRFQIGTVEAQLIEHPQDTNTHGKVLVVVPKGHALMDIIPRVEVSTGADYGPKEQQDFTHSEATPIPYTVTAEDGTQVIYDVTVRKASSKAEITKFVINNVQGEIKESEKTIFVKLPADTDLTSLTPTVEVSKGAKCNTEGAKNFVNSMAEPIDYTVTAEDGSTTATYKVKVRNISKEAKILEFKVGTVKGRIHKTELTIFAELAYNVSLNPITPTIKISEYATISPAPNTPQDFTNSLATPKNYTVTAEDGSTKATYQVTIVQNSKSQRYTVHGRDVSPALKVEVPNSVKSITKEHIQAWFKDANDVETIVPSDKIRLDIPEYTDENNTIKNGDITKDNQTVKIDITVLPFNNFAGMGVSIEVTKKD